MKKIAAFLFTVFIVFCANAQKIKVTEGREDIAGGRNNALITTLYGVSPGEAEDSFRSYMKKYKGNRTSKDGGIFIDNAEVKEINGNGTVDVYGKAFGKNDDPEIKFVVAFDMGTVFLNSSEHKNQFKEAEKIVREFAVKATKEAIEAKLKAEVKKYSKLVSGLEDLVKENKELNDEIEKYKAKIKQNEADIVSNNTDQGKKKSEIEAQKKVVDAIDSKLKAVE